MSRDPSTSMLRFGGVVPTKPLALRAGPLDLLFDDGGLRTIRLEAREVVRRIYIAVRDRNWSTVPTRVSLVHSEVGHDTFHLVCRAECQQDEIDFCWEGTIHGDPTGRISFVMEGRARTAFLRNRIGFCVLHPPRECCGARCRVARSDGIIVEGRFPERIAPTNPFQDIVGISHQVADGLWCRLDITGDVFEMEDQRNWADASFKTFCTSLRLPYPVPIAAGSTVRQSVTLSLEGAAPAMNRRPAGPAGDTVRIRLSGSPARSLPPIGLGSAGHHQPVSLREQTLLSALNLSHLRIELALAGRARSERLRAGWNEARALGVPLEMALFVTDDAETEFATLAREVEEIGPTICRWLVLPASESTASVDRWCRVARQHLTRFCPAAMFGTGTDHSFVEINRRRPQMADCDFLCFSMNPQVHATDHRSIVETLDTLEELVTSTREIVGAVPLVVSPITLKMRSNPAATGPERNPAPDELPASVDPRQPSLFAAAWTLAAIKRLAEAGVASLTCYETAGWRGVMENEAGSPSPQAFASIPGAVFAMYHVFADLGEFRGGEIIPSLATRPLDIETLLLRQAGRQRLLVANTSTETIQIVIDPGVLSSGSIRCVRLNANNVLRAMQSPGEFREEAGAELESGRSGLRLELEPCELVRLDVGTSGETASATSRP